MVMPGDNTTITGELITPVAIEKGSAVRDSRGRPHRRRRHDHRDYRVVEAQGSDSGLATTLA